MIHCTGPIPPTIDSSDMVGLLFDCVGYLVDGLEPHDVGFDTVAASAIRVDVETLDRMASVLALQLQHALALTVSDEDRRDLALATVEEASSLRRCSPAALGAIISMVEAIVYDDVEATGGLALAAVEYIDAVDLFEAATSVSAAIAWNVADRLALDPTNVVRELRAGLSNTTPGTRACRSSSGRPSRRDDQTWSGRNSQCHGSRGTASTQPNLGPLVFSH